MKLEQKRIKKRVEKIKKFGKAIKGQNGILGWKLGKEEVVNDDYQFPEENGISTSNIYDLIRDIKNSYKGEKITIRWPAKMFEILLGFIWINGWGKSLLSKKVVYMGVSHIKDIKIENYTIEKSL